MKRALVQTTGVDKNSNSQQVLIKTVTVIYPELELPQPTLNVRGEGGSLQEDSETVCSPATISSILGRIQSVAELHNISSSLVMT